jgi:integrase
MGGRGQVYARHPLVSGALGGRLVGMPRHTNTPGVFFFKRGDRWVGRWTDPVTKKRHDVTLETIGVTTAEDRRTWAKRKSAEFVERKRNLALGRHTGQTPLEGAIESLVTAKTASRKRPATVYDYKRAAATLAAWLKDDRDLFFVEEITPRELTRYRERVLKIDASPVTINNHLRCIRVVLSFWRKTHRLPHVTPEEIAHVCEQIAQDDSPPTPLTPAQIRALLEQAAKTAAREPRFTAAVVIALGTGMRCGELERLAWDQVDLDAFPGGTIKLDAATKTRRGRTIDLSVCPTTRDVLRLLRARNEGAFVLGRHKVLDRAVMKRWIHQNQVAGFEWSWQVLRQTCESFLVCSPGLGFGIYKAAKQVGHTVAVAEKHYVDIVRGIPPEARVLEDAMQARAEFIKCLAAVRA